MLSPQPVMKRVGRFLLLQQIDHGGLGMVYAAYDEQLDRKVAVKVTREDHILDDEQRLRFHREAQALAQLSDPNVVTVHEVGESDGRVFVAMEYVHGISFSAWLTTEPGWRAVLEAFVLAGLGLKAAHDAELVHGRFEPANIIRGDDGTVKVLGFGLGRVPAEGLDELIDRSPASRSRSGSAAARSDAGTVVGTPEYTAPEQLSGLAVDARSDQYSFCVALWEGFVGSRPFEGSGHGATRETDLTQPPAWPSTAPAVPRVIVEALRRGLSADPNARWTSMDALLQELSWQPRRRRGRWLVGLAGVGVLGVGGVTAQAWLHARAQRCTGAHQQLAGIWDDARRTEVQEAIVGTGQSYASELWTRTREKLDAYATTWEAVHTEACEATTVRAEQSLRVMDLRMRCLQRAAEQLRATVETLADADASVVTEAHHLVAGLQPLSRCEDADALEAQVEPPLQREVEAVAAARRHLARAKSQGAAGRYEAAREAVAAAAEELQDVEYEVVHVELMLERGHVLAALGDYSGAEATLLEAVEHASRLRQRGLLADAVIDLMGVVGGRQQRAKAAMLLRPLALGASRGDMVREAKSRSTIANVLHAQGKYEEAEQEHRTALRLQSEALEPGHPEVVQARNDLAAVLVHRGDYEAAEAEFRAVLAQRIKALGPGHPKVAASRSNLGAVMQKQGHYEAAEVELRAALSLRVDALGPLHPKVAASRNNLGLVLYLQREYEAAGVELRKALELRIEALGPRHPEVAASRSNLGVILMENGDLEEAEAQYRAALALKIEALGPRHPEIATLRHNLGLVLGKQGDFEGAEVESRAALALRLETLGPAHPEIASSRNNLGYLLRAQGKHEEAESEHRMALALALEALGPVHPSVVQSRQDLGLALHGQGKYEEAEAEYRKALALLVQLHGPDDVTVAESRSSLAGLLLTSGKYAQAEQECTAALSLFEQLGSDNQGAVRATTVLAEAMFELHRQDEALAVAEDALRRARSTATLASSAKPKFLLARILWRIEGPARDRPRAKRLAQEALHAMKEQEKTEPGAAREVEQWLARRIP